MNILENINNASQLLLVISAFCFYMYLKRIKLTRKLTSFEITLYIISQLAYILWGITLIAKIWG
ncbi:MULTISPECIES: hypothetical protein [Bacillus]|uniref:Uncharacterized protein n=3 Tax=Bacillus cereus group TaxID=86661 RepID=A0A9X7G0G5_BACTU|nr:MULTISPECIES: hypothetical protein [Bacillus cereus group]PAW42768.1 hypothetical protein CKQ70_25080 [Bacillus toyonensis]ACK97476.1 conserved domain protein [Bacillus cereus G9842]AQY37418.1 hypothetical protein B4918_05145 [Bacillus thuringiensis]KAA6467864.1 hypothetical protein DX930_01450 [Bacillus cereus]KAA6480497.1 hypothetical protein DX931_19765 [Bacillus cereus]